MPTSTPWSQSVPREGLFRDRCPEAAARQLATVLVHLVECELASLDRMRARKGTSQADIRRQASICETAIEQLRDLNVPADTLGLRGTTNLRVTAALNAP